jgi:competence protein ComEC
MLWVAAVYSLGILAGVYAWRPATWWVAGGLIFTLAAGYFIKRRPAFGWLLALVAFALVGALHIQLRSAAPRLDTTIVPYADRHELEVTAHVVSEGRVQYGGFGEHRQTLDLKCEQIQTEDGQIVPVHSGIRVSVYTPLQEDSSAEPLATLSQIRTLHYGDRIRFLTKLRPPRNFRNPGAFDHEGYLAERGIAAVGSAKFENVELLPGFTGGRLERIRNRMHASVIAKVHKLWPPREAARIDAMIIGEEAFIDRDTRVDFQRSGTYHILVVSGMNVSILAFVVFWTLRRMRVGDIVGAPVWRAT